MMTSAERYIPTTLEKKRAISSLLFMGIVMMLTRGIDLTSFERYYLSLSLSFWVVAIVLFPVTLIIFFIVDVLGYFFVLILVIWGVLWIFCIQQARAGVSQHQFILIRLLVSFGEWMLSLFSEDSATAQDQDSHDSQNTSSSQPS